VNLKLEVKEDVDIFSDFPSKDEYVLQITALIGVIIKIPWEG